MMQPYLYDDVGYRHSSIHRKAIVYDQLNTDNPIILDYLQTSTWDLYLSNCRC